MGEGDAGRRCPIVGGRGLSEPSRRLGGGVMSHWPAERDTKMHPRTKIPANEEVPVDDVRFCDFSGRISVPVNRVLTVVMMIAALDSWHILLTHHRKP